MYLKSPWKVLEKGMSWSVGTMSLQIYMSFTFEMDIGKGILAIDIYNFIHA